MTINRGDPMKLFTAVVAAALGVVLVPSVASAPRAPRPRPVTVTATSSCVDYAWTVTATITSTTTRTVDVVSDDDTGTWVQGTIALVANRPALFVWEPSAMAQKEGVFVYPTGREQADPLAETVTFDPVQSNPRSLC